MEEVALETRDGDLANLHGRWRDTQLISSSPKVFLGEDMAKKRTRLGKSVPLTT